MSHVVRLQVWLESLSAKWYFYLFLVLASFFVPMWASRGYDWQDYSSVIYSALSVGLAPYSALFPIIHLVFYFLLGLVFFYRDRVSRLFSLFVMVSYAFFALVQSVVYTEAYGLVVLSSNLLLFLLVSFVWALEALVHRNVLVFSGWSRVKALFVILAFLAFWFPVNPSSLGPDFNPLYLLFSESILTFCMMTPVFLTFLLLFYPRINIVTLRVTSFIGLLIGLYNLQGLILDPGYLWWMVTLHLPLIIISLYAFIKSFRKPKKRKKKK